VSHAGLTSPIDGLSLSAAKAALGVRFRDCGGMNTGAVAPATPIYIIGHATSLIGLIPPRACHLTDLALSVTFGAAGVAGGGASTTFTVTIYKKAISGANKVWAAWTLTNPQNSTGYNLAPSKTAADGDAGMDAFNGVDDYLTMVLTTTNCTNCSGQLHWNFSGTVD
jgi:hypothetical protein